MTQHAPAGRDARLGRPIGTSATEDGTVHGVVLLLPGGVPDSLRRSSPLTAAALRPLARTLVRAAPDAPLVAHVVHYRYRGWNGEAAHPVADTAWALDEIGRRYGEVPVCLVGTDLGARAALRAASHPAVHAVLALGPWLPETGEEPVRQLIGRQVLLVHGTDDRRTAPELSYRLAERAKKADARVCRFEVHSDRHGLRQRREDVAALAADFVRGTLCGQDFTRPLRDALAAPPPLGLRMPLATGFGRPPR